MLKTKLIEEGNVLTAHFTGDIDHHGARRAREDIDYVLNTSLPKHLVLDFERVDFIDSSAVGLIMGRYRLVSQLGGTVSIINLNSRCRKLLELSGVTAIVRIR